MAEVFLARTPGVGGFSKLMVIKRMLPHLGDDPEFVELFLNEGRIAARLGHPNICQVYDIGEVDGALFLAMEYLDGLVWADLVGRLPSDGPARLRCAAAVLGQICEGLCCAHELCDVDGTATPIVHRDVSPQNIFVTTTGACKLLDFGVSKILTEGSRTRTGTLKGKLPYMAPEQIRGEPVDARVDVFALGVVLWEALTGVRLFKRDSDYLIWRAITEGEIPTATSIRPQLPPEIDAVVQRALARDRDERYPTVRAFAHDLHTIAVEVGGALGPQDLAAMLRSAGAARLAAQSERVARALGGQAHEPATETSSAGTAALALRTQSIKLGHRRRRWPQIAGAVAILSGAAVAVTATRSPAADSPAVTAVSPVDASPVHVEAAAPAAPPAPLPARYESSVVIARRDTRASSVRRAGMYSVDSTPYAHIFIDGKPYGDTPLFKAELTAGVHRVRAVRADGKTQLLTITVEPGKVISSGTLRW